MTPKNLRDLSEAIRDLRFIQASAITALRLPDNKKTKDYMNKLAVLQKLCEAEALK